MVLCPQCSTANQDRASFCLGCGTSLNPCPACGSSNRSAASYCLSCGGPLKAVCPKCGAANRSQARFCRACCAPLSVRDQALSSRCAACGHVNRPRASFCLSCGSPLARPRYGTGKLPPNTKLHNRYVVLQKVAQGGQGAVYQVKDEHLVGKLWALKEMSDAHIAVSERQQAVAGFLREAELLATLEHPNLPKVVDVFEELDKHYMVMEYIDGQNLSEILKRASQPLSLERVLEWAEQLCDVLGYLHSQEQPIIYRDLKPQNVMEVTGTHKLKLIDFGIARFYKPGKKRDTEKMGTPGYAPPEQYGHGQTDARSDVYALGALLHCLLTLRDPATQLFSFPRVRDLNPDVPREVDEAIAQATRVRAESRFASMEEMSQALLGRKKERAPDRPRASRPQRPSPAAMPSPPLPVPAASGGLVLSQRRLDFGILERGASLSRTFQVGNGAGLKGKVQASDPWVQVSPATTRHSGQVVNVTVSTTSLELAQNGSAPLVPPWMALVRDRVQQVRSDSGWKLAGLVLLSPLLAVGLGMAMLAHLHGRYLVPFPRDHQSWIRVKTSSGDGEVEVRVTVQPSKRELALGWLKVAGAMLVEAGVVGAVILILAGV
jgi:serine/threonine protein kinase